MARLRPPVAPSHPLASPRALASFATSQHAPEMLIRGGPYQRAVKVMASGADAKTASVVAAAQGKGHVAELAQSAHFTASSAALGGPHHARPHPLANDPRVDVEVRRGRARVSGSQVKVGSPQYVRRAVRAGKYENLIVNAESFEHVVDEPGVIDRLGHAGIAAPQLDLRSLVPLDWAAIAISVSKTSRALIVHEDKVHGGFGGELAARIVSELFPVLDAPVDRVGSTFTPVSFHRVLERAILPDVARVLNAARKTLAF